MTDKLNASSAPYIVGGSAKNLVAHFAASQSIGIQLVDEGTPSLLSVSGEYGIPGIDETMAVIHEYQNETKVKYERLSYISKTKVLVISGAVDLNTKAINLAGFSGLPGMYEYDGVGLQINNPVTKPYLTGLEQVMFIDAGSVLYTTQSGNNYKLFLPVRIDQDALQRNIDYIATANPGGATDYDFYFGSITSLTSAGTTVTSNQLVGPVVVSRVIYDSGGQAYMKLGIKYPDPMQFSSDGLTDILDFTLENTARIADGLTVQAIDVINPFIPDGSSSRTMVSAIDLKQFVTEGQASWSVAIPCIHDFVSNLGKPTQFGFQASTTLRGPMLNEKKPIRSDSGENILVLNKTILAEQDSSPGFRSPLKNVFIDKYPSYLYWGAPIDIMASQGLSFRMDPEFHNFAKNVIQALTLCFLYRAPHGTTAAQVEAAISHGDFKYSLPAHQYEDNKLGLGASYVTNIFASGESRPGYVRERYPDSLTEREQIYEKELGTGIYKANYQYITRYMGTYLTEGDGPNQVTRWRAFDANGTEMPGDAVEKISQGGFAYFFVLVTLSHISVTGDSKTGAPAGTSIFVMPIDVAGDGADYRWIAEKSICGNNLHKYCGEGHRFLNVRYSIIPYKKCFWDHGKLVDQTSQEVGSVHNITSELITAPKSIEHAFVINDGRWQAMTNTEHTGHLGCDLRGYSPNVAHVIPVTGEANSALSVSNIEMPDVRGKYGTIYGNGLFDTDNNRALVKFVLSYDLTGKDGPIQIPYQHITNDPGYPVQKMKFKCVGPAGKRVFIICTEKNIIFKFVTCPSDEYIEENWGLDSLEDSTKLSYGGVTAVIGLGLIGTNGHPTWTRLAIRDSVNTYVDFNTTFTFTLDEYLNDVCWCFVPDISSFIGFPRTAEIIAYRGSDYSYEDCTYSQFPGYSLPVTSGPDFINLFPYIGPGQDGFVSINKIIKWNKEEFRDNVDYGGFLISGQRAHHDGHTYFDVTFDDFNICGPHPIWAENDVGKTNLESGRFHTAEYDKIKIPGTIFSDATEVLPGELVSVMAAETPSFLEEPDILCGGLPRIGAKFPSGKVYFKTESFETGREYYNNEGVRIADARLSARVVSPSYDTQIGKLFVEFLPGSGKIVYGPNVIVAGKPKIEKILPEETLHDEIQLIITGRNFVFPSGISALHRLVVTSDWGEYIGDINLTSAAETSLTGTLELAGEHHWYKGNAYVYAVGWCESNAYPVIIDATKDKYGNPSYKKGSVFGDILAPDFIVPGKTHNIFGPGAARSSGIPGIILRTPGITYELKNESFIRIIGNQSYIAITADVMARAKLPYTTYTSVSDGNGLALRLPYPVYVNPTDINRDDLGHGAIRNFSMADGLSFTLPTIPLDLNVWRRIPVTIGGGTKVVVFLWKPSSKSDDRSGGYGDFLSTPFGEKDIRVTDHGIDVYISTKLQNAGWVGGDWGHIGIQVNDYTFFSKFPAFVCTMSPQARTNVADFGDLGAAMPVVIPGESASEETTQNIGQVSAGTAEKDIRFVGTALRRRGDGIEYDFFIEESWKLNDTRISVITDGVSFDVEQYSNDHPSTYVRDTDEVRVTRERSGLSSSKQITRSAEYLSAGLLPIKLGPEAISTELSPQRNYVEYIPRFTPSATIPVYSEQDGRIESSSLNHFILTIVGESFTDNTQFSLVDSTNPSLERFTSRGILHVEPWHVRISDVQNKHTDRIFSRAIVIFEPVSTVHVNDLVNGMLVYAREPHTQMGTMNEALVIPHNAVSLSDAQSLLHLNILNTNGYYNLDNTTMFQVPSFSTMFRNEPEDQNEYDIVPIDNPFNKFRIRIIGTWLHAGFKPSIYLVDNNNNEILEGEVREEISGVNVLYADFDASSITTEGYYGVKLVVPYRKDTDEWEYRTGYADRSVYLRQYPSTEVVNYSNGRFQDRFIPNHFFMQAPGERFVSGNKFTVTLANCYDLVEKYRLQFNDVIPELEFWLWYEDDTITTQKKLEYIYHSVPTGFFAGPTTLPTIDTQHNILWVPDDYTTIQEAINMAGEGDVIVVRDGIYVENIDFIGKNIWLRSENGPDLCIIDGNRETTVVTIENFETRETTLEGFTIRNGFIAYGQAYGGGISIISASPTIRNNIIENNIGEISWGGSGAGIYISEWTSIPHDTMSPYIHNNTIKNNGMVGQGGGITVFNSHAVIENNIIENNKSSFAGSNIGYGGGIYYGLIHGHAYGNPVRGAIIRHNIIAANSAPTTGGGIFIAPAHQPSLSDPVIIDSNLIIENILDKGYALTPNPYYGGGIGMIIYAADPTAELDVDIINNMFIGNEAFLCGGGFALFNYNTPQVFTGINITNNTFYGNRITFDTAPGFLLGCGGAIGTFNSKINVYNNICWSSTAPGTDKEIAYDGTSGHGMQYQPVVWHCDVHNGWPYGGQGNIDQDPLLDSSSYHLTRISPCLDVGYNTAPAIPDEDYDNEARIAARTVDMGADEYHEFSGPWITSTGILPTADIRTKFGVGPDHAVPNQEMLKFAIRVPRDYATIQGAINAAKSGDTILVSNGTYNENIDFIGKDINLKSMGGPTNCIIRGLTPQIEDNYKPVIRLMNNETNGAIIDGFTIKNGYGEVVYQCPT
jgi:hypothetical protein